MSWYHKVCSECVLNNDCLFQDDNDVESCEDIQNYEMEKNET